MHYVIPQYHCFVFIFLTTIFCSYLNVCGFECSSVVFVCRLIATGIDFSQKINVLSVLTYLYYFLNNIITNFFYFFLEFQGNKKFVFADTE